ncbi:transmembrane domain-containing protein [Cryptosporidium ubiquitum]|uniref:Transmembrane domain-containing protein n=1 Tax=Cryptosporidium ubiquitum TaxID=857276 RepID=A0A1J4MGR3_9CRYT|nr:transmembrane domain-containing protein [Cryptosporidium ubiquitum]OII73422.1 transmembrane domain-containing protein [Cryptosporidium ubiquitum]
MRSKTGYILTSLLIFIALIITGIVVLRKCANIAKDIIEKNILAFKPEIVMTSDFSAVSMSKVNSRISKVPLIMFSPSIINFKRFTLSRMELEPERFQSLMIVQSLNDKIVPTRDIMELISGFNEEQVRTHFVQGVGSLLPTYASLSSEQLKEYMVEILQMASDNSSINGDSQNINNTEMQRFGNNSNTMEMGVDKLVSNRLQTMHTFTKNNYGINLPSLRKPISLISRSPRNSYSRYKSLSSELNDSGYNEDTELDENEQSPLIVSKEKQNTKSIYNPKPSDTNELFNQLKYIKEDNSSDYNSDRT